MNFKAEYYNGKPEILAFYVSIPLKYEVLSITIRKRKRLCVGVKYTAVSLLQLMAYNIKITLQFIMANNTLCMLNI